MSAEVQEQSTLCKLNEAVQKYTDHEYVYASLLTVAGIFSVLVFSGPLLAGA